MAGGFMRKVLGNLFIPVVSPESFDANGDAVVTADGDPSSNVEANLRTLISGEDQDNDVIKVEGQFLNKWTNASESIVAVSGFLHAFTISQETTATATQGFIGLYDTTMASADGTPIFKTYIAPNIGGREPVSIIKDIIFTNGLYVDYSFASGNGNLCVDISYR